MSVTPPSPIWRDVSEDRDGGDTIMVESVDNIGLGVSKAELFDSGDSNLPDSEATKRLSDLLVFGDTKFLNSGVTELLDPEAVKFFEAEDNELVNDSEDAILLDSEDPELLDSGVTELLDSEALTFFDSEDNELVIDSEAAILLDSGDNEIRVSGSSVLLVSKDNELIVSEDTEFLVSGEDTIVEVEVDSSGRVSEGKALLKDFSVKDAVD